MWLSIPRTILHSIVNMDGCRVVNNESKLPHPCPPKPTKDCRVCNRRRIKCDRTTPSCKKCDSRNLACPGYGLKLNWDWGLASRGKLAGKRLPSVSSTVAEKPKELISGSILSTESAPCSGESSIFRVQGGESNATATSIVSYQHSRHVDINPLLCLPSSLLQDNISRRLFHHYEQFIAASMVWVDSDTNPWRTVMIPMALQSPSLLISILALAAEHLSVVSNQDDVLGRTLTSRSMAYRDRALQLLAVDMRSDAVAPAAKLLSESEVMHRNQVANSLLASMLVLCNMETVRPGMLRCYSSSTTKLIPPSRFYTVAGPS